MPLTIYPETPLWNELYDQGADPYRLLESLRQQDAYLVISTQLVSELAATFESTRITDPVGRGRGLFSYLLKFIAYGTPCLKMNKQLLQDEAMKITGEIREFETTLSDVDRAAMTKEVQKLAAGTFDHSAREFLVGRSTLRREL